MSDQQRTAINENGPTDFADPATIDVDEVMANINNSWTFRRMHWDETPTWPNVTVKALADEVQRLRYLIADVTPTEVMQFMCDEGVDVDPVTFADMLDVRRDVRKRRENGSNPAGDQ